MAASASKYRVQNPVEGVYVVSGAFDASATFSEDAEQLRTYGKRGAANFNAKSGNTRKRTIRPITSRFGKTCKLVTELCDAIQRVSPVIGWSVDDKMPNGTSVIASKPGCMEQDPHTDYNVGDPAFADCPLNSLPFTVFLALDDETRFVVYGPVASCDDADRLELRVNAKDLIFVRGDVVHSGAAFSETNTRILTYVD
jgi:hypothetical protein